MSRAMRVFCLVGMVTSVAYSLSAQSQTGGIVGAWVDEKAKPKQVLIVAPATRAFRMTLLPGNEYQRQKSFFSSLENDSFHFNDEDESYILTPRLEEGVIIVEHAFANVPDSFISDYTPLTDLSLVASYRVLNDSSVRLRKAGSVGAPIVRTLEKGEVVKVLEIGDGIAAIQGKKGHWVKARDVARLCGMDI